VDSHNVLIPYTHGTVAISHKSPCVDNIVSTTFIKTRFSANEEWTTFNILSFRKAKPEKRQISRFRLLTHPNCSIRTEYTDNDAEARIVSKVKYTCLWCYFYIFTYQWLHLRWRPAVSTTNSVGVWRLISMEFLDVKGTKYSFQWSTQNRNNILGKLLKIYRRWIKGCAMPAISYPFSKRNDTSVALHFKTESVAAGQQPYSTFMSTDFVVCH